MTNYEKRKNTADKVFKVGAALAVGSLGALVAGIEPSLAYLSAGVAGAVASYAGFLEKDNCDYMLACQNASKIVDPNKELKEAMRRGFEHFFNNMDDLQRKHFFNQFAKNIRDSSNKL